MQIIFVTGTAKMDQVYRHINFTTFITLLHYNYLSVQAITMKFLSLMNNLISNILQLTEGKYCTQNQNIKHCLIWCICADLVPFCWPGPILKLHDSEDSL